MMLFVTCEGGVTGTLKAEEREIVRPGLMLRSDTRRVSASKVNSLCMLRFLSV
jgi:hypothetical protein